MIWSDLNKDLLVEDLKDKVDEIIGKNNQAHEDVILIRVID